jgi:hypothetical protein
MPSSGFSITISAVDAASKNIDAVNKKLASIRAPAERLQKQFNKFGDLSGLTKVKEGFEGIARGGLNAFRSVARVVEPLAVVTGALSVAGMYRLVEAWGQFGSQLGFAAARMGIAGTQLQGLQGAAVLAGASSGSLTSGLQNLGQTMYDAIGGRAPEAVALFNQLGISFDDGTRHARKVTDVLPELADKIAAMKDPFTQARVATALFGGAAEDLLPFLRRGSAGIKEYTAIAQKYGLMNETSIEGANKFREQLAESSLAATGLSNALAGLAATHVPFKWWNDEVAEMTGSLNKLLEQEQEVDFLNAKRAKLSPEKKKELHNMEAHRALHAAIKDTEKEIEGGDYRYWKNPDTATSKFTGNVKPGDQKAALAFFESQAGGGWKPAQAAGLVANLVAESGLKPGASGDSGMAYGVGQWHGDRQADFKKFVGHDIKGSTLEEQLRFYNFELTEGKEQAAGKKLRGAATPYDAGSIVSRYDERPAAVDEAATNRGHLAQQIAMKDGAPGASGKVDINVKVSGSGVQQVTARSTGNVNQPKIASSQVGTGNGGT